MKIDHIPVHGLKVDFDLQQVLMTFDQLREFGDICVEIGAEEARQEHNDVEEWLHHIPAPLKKVEHYVYLEGREHPIQISDYIYRAIKECEKQQAPVNSRANIGYNMPESWRR